MTIYSHAENRQSFFEQSDLDTIVAPVLAHNQQRKAAWQSIPDDAQYDYRYKVTAQTYQAGLEHFHTFCLEATERNAHRYVNRVLEEVATTVSDRIGRLKKGQRPKTVADAYPDQDFSKPRITNKGHNFVMVHNVILDNYDLTAVELATYIRIKRHENKDHQSWPSVGTLAKKLYAEKKTVRNAIRKLCSLGLLRVEPQKSKKHHKENDANLYTILDPKPILREQSNTSQWGVGQNPAAPQGAIYPTLGENPTAEVDYTEEDPQRKMKTLPAISASAEKRGKRVGNDFGYGLREDLTGKAASPFNGLTTPSPSLTQEKLPQGQPSRATSSQDQAAERRTGLGNLAGTPWFPPDSETPYPEEIPEDFGLSPYNRWWIANAQAKGHFEELDVESVLETYIYHAMANGLRKSNWDKDFRQYLIRTEGY